MSQKSSDSHYASSWYTRTDSTFATKQLLVLSRKPFGLKGGQCPPGIVVRIHSNSTTQKPDYKSRALAWYPLPEIFLKKYKGVIVRIAREIELTQNYLGVCNFGTLEFNGAQAESSILVQSTKVSVIPYNRTYRVH